MHGAVAPRGYCRGTQTKDERIAASVRETLASVVLAAFACVLFAGSATLCTTDIQPQTNGVPLVALIGFVVSVALAFHSMRGLTRRR